MILAQIIFWYCGGFRAVSLFVKKSAIFFKAVFKFKFGFPYVLLVAMPTLYHEDSFAGRIKCILYEIYIYICLVSPSFM